MKKLPMILVCLLMMLCACGGDQIHQLPVVFPTGEYEKPFEDPGTRFTLTDTQQSLYDNYTKNFNFKTSVFKGASPVDVAQVFIECGINGLWEGEYNLFYFESTTVSKAAYKKEFDDDMDTRDIRTRRDFADLLFPYLKDGVFVDEGNGSGYVEFDSFVSLDYESIDTVKAKINLHKVKDVWMINQNHVLEYVD